MEELGQQHARSDAPSVFIKDICGLATQIDAQAKRCPYNRDALTILAHRVCQIVYLIFHTFNEIPLQTDDDKTLWNIQYTQRGTKLKDLLDNIKEFVDMQVHRYRLVGILLRDHATIETYMERLYEAARPFKPPRPSEIPEYARMLAVVYSSQPVFEDSQSRSDVPMNIKGMMNSVVEKIRALEFASNP
ncbi:hypothetical protein Moror_14574 [Moniliophthora roreri MCA 2997]|nr:hypothetical protein Moror_14574 [Moniliophthora roreri MCA 2997]